MEVRIVTASTLIHVLFSDANWGKMIVSIDINLRQLSFLKMFLVTIFEHGGHLGHVTKIIYVHFGSPFL